MVIIIVYIYIYRERERERERGHADSFRLRVGARAFEFAASGSEFGVHELDRVPGIRTHCLRVIIIKP